MSFRAIGNRIIVKKVNEGETITAGGLILAESLTTELDKTAKAIVVSVGSGRKPDGTMDSLDVEVGDTILYHRHYGTDLSGTFPTEDDKDLMSLTFEDVLAVLPA